jgi:hypothetical protein
MISLGLIPPGEIDAIILVVAPGLAGERDAILLVVTPGLAGERDAMLLVVTSGLDVTFDSVTMSDGSVFSMDASTVSDLVFLQDSSRISKGIYCIT